MAYVKTTWSTGDVITATALNNLETQHEKILGEANSYTATPTFTTGAIFGGNISSTGSLVFMIDSDNNGGELFALRANGGASNVFYINETGGGLFRDQVYQTGSAATYYAEGYSTATETAPAIRLDRSNSSTIGTRTLVSSGQRLGSIGFSGANGTSFDSAAQIRAYVDGTPGASNDMPGRLSFWTTPDASATPVERLRISADGTVTQYSPSASNVESRIETYSTTTSHLGTFTFYRSLTDTVGGNTAPTLGTTVGRIRWSAANGTGSDTIASIQGTVDGAIGGPNDAPGRIGFFTTPDGGGSLTERMRLNNAGSLIQIGTGTMPSTPAVNGQSVTVLKELYSTGSVGLQMHRESADANSARMIFMKRRSGYSTAVQNGDGLGYIQFDGASTESNATDTGAAIRVEATGTWTTTSYPSKIILSAVASGSTTLTDQLTVNPNGITVAGTITEGSTLLTDKYQILDAPVCRATRNGNQSINNTTWTKIDLDGEDIDPKAMHSTVTNITRVTVPVAGVYRVYGRVQYEANATGIRGIDFYKNNSGLSLTSTYVDNLGAGTSASATNSAIVKCAANDYIEILGYQSSGGALNVQAAVLEVELIRGDY